MLGFFKSLFAPSDRVKSVAHFVGHNFIFRDYDSKNVSMEVRVARAESRNFQVFTIRHQATGKSETSHLVNAAGEVQGNGPNTYGDFFGLPVSFWLPPALSSSGTEFLFAGHSMEPLEARVLGESLWKGVQSLALEFELLGQTARANYEKKTGVLIGQTGTGYLAATSLKMPLPEF